MKIVNAMVGTLLLAAVPLAAQAEDMSYSYIDLGYAETDLDGGPSGDGFGARGSIGFGENFFAFTDYLTQDFGPVDVDVVSVGLGGHLSIAENVDLVGRAGYLQADASAGGFSTDEDGYVVAAGLRGRVADQVELEGNVIHRDLGGSGSSGDTAVAVGGRYYFTDAVAVGAEYEHSDDGATIFAGVRFSF
jgi:outer membrane protein with beta-barrel domain